MIDLHTHILPGVDDGVKTEDESVEFARVAHDDGVRSIVATPHCRDGFFVNERDEVLVAVERLRRRLADERVDVVIEPGAEVHLCPDLPARVRDGRALTLGNNGKTLLLELSLSQYPVNVDDVLFQLKLAGVEVVLAHPERIRFFQEDVSRYEALVRMGAWGQLTTGSLTGSFGGDVQAFSETLLKRGLVHVLASDAHNVRGRPPLMSHAVEVAAEMVGEERARAMVDDAPRALLDGRGPDLPPVSAKRPQRSILSRLFGRS